MSVSCYVRDTQAKGGFRVAQVADVSTRQDKLGAPLGARTTLDHIEVGGKFARKLQAQAPQLLGAFRDAKNARSRDEYAHHARAFGSMLGEQLDKMRSTKQTDSDLYSLLAQFEVMGQVIENIVLEPELVDLLPNVTVGTLSPSATYKKRTRRTAIPRRSWEPDFGAGTSSFEEEDLMVNFIPLSKTESMSRLQKQREAEYNARTSTPWDRFGAGIEASAHSIRSGCGSIVAHGDTGIGVFGLLNNSEVTNIQQVNWFPAAGLAAYNAIFGEVSEQWKQVGHDPRYMGDTLILPSEHFHLLSGLLVSSTGDNDTTVISMLFANLPQLSRIAFARELDANAADLANLTPKIGEDRADDIQGGYRVSEDDHRAAMVVTKAANDVQEVIMGHDLMIEPLMRPDDGEAAHLRASCGGVKVYRPEVPRISYLP
ncbi:MAG: hypothetical protein ACPG4T_04605 [Nannocystaceae bacterium]